MSTFYKVLRTYSSIFKKSVLSTYSSTLKNASTQYLLKYCTSVLTPSLQSSGRPCVVRRRLSLSTFSNDFSSEAARPNLFIFHIYYLQFGGTNICVFYFDRVQKCIFRALRTRARDFVRKEAYIFNIGRSPDEYVSCNVETYSLTPEIAIDFG